MHKVAITDTSAKWVGAPAVNAKSGFVNWLHHSDLQVRLHIPANKTT